MKKQYRYEKVGFNRVHLYTYHNGKVIKSEILDAYEFTKEICKLKSNGYVYGYTTEEIEETKERYEKMLMNAVQ